MNSQPLVDPELAPLAETMRLMRFSFEVVAARQQMFAGGYAAVRVNDDLPIEEEERFIPGPAGAPQLRALIYKPKNAVKPMPAFYHIHGGGYMMGAPEMMYPLHRQIAVALGCVIVSIDYRLAPGTPFPGAIEDCYAGLQWMHGAADELGIDRTRIAIGGESAGGGLAAALALIARDRGEIPILAQILNAPMIDDRTCTLAAPHPFTGEFVWTREHNIFGWTSLLGHAPGGPDVSIYAAAARATDLNGLPPAYISVGALDLFLEEDVEYARRLTRAGVPVELHVYPGAFHGFEMAAAAALTLRSQKDSLEALRRALGV